MVACGACSTHSRFKGKLMVRQQQLSMLTSQAVFTAVIQTKCAQGEQSGRQG